MQEYTGSSLASYKLNRKLSHFFKGTVLGYGKLQNLKVET